LQKDEVGQAEKRQRIGRETKTTKKAFLSRAGLPLERGQECFW
jgi:hypothetical protein